MPNVRSNICALTVAVTALVSVASTSGTPALRGGARRFETDHLRKRESGGETPQIRSLQGSPADLGHSSLRIPRAGRTPKK